MRKDLLFSISLCPQLAPCLHKVLDKIDKSLKLLLYPDVATCNRQWIFKLNFVVIIVVIVVVVVVVAFVAVIIP